MSILVVLAVLAGLVSLLVVLPWLVFVGWMLLRIVYRAAYPPEPKKCLHCGKPIP